ncbi:MAG TPA: carboxypeptidase regulatory-like domain-containing protein [Vicinamibacterales bacterium]|nr:carboxypeptidase regulatory-like domain-containing protein [Vicinamibacterales bacterium]
MPRLNIIRTLFALIIFIAAAAGAGAQTFRGGISGRVIDPSDAVLPGVTVTATNRDTGASRTTTTSATGDFSFPDLPLGTYNLEAELSGFQTQKATVEVAVSRISAIDIKMGLSNVAETVTVSGVALTLDTKSTALANVINPKQVQDLPLNGRDFTRMLQLSPGVAGTSVNGVRTRGNNYQIDGADNNDAFQNVAAVNQGGVSGIAGTLLPIEAIDQFAVQSGGEAETGRNAGSSINLVMKSGTNEIKGSTYYFNRNEALSANSPTAAPGTPKREIRNNQFGFSLGGPIVHNKMFYFTTFEAQKLTAANSLPDTAPTPAWQAQATQLLTQFGVPVSSVATKLLALWPADSMTGGATALNFVSADPNTYNSYNGIVKVDQQLNSVHNLSVRYFGGGGDQVAQINSPYLAYFQAVPSRMHNVSAVETAVFTPHLVNQFVFGFNYFLQKFNSFDTSANPLSLGLNTGVTDPTLAGPPNITISGFAAVGGTQPLGRIDKTVQFTDSATYAIGAHQIKIGGEGRVAKLFIFYDSNERGTFTFDGTVGPWASLPASQASSALKALADYMSGKVATGSIVRGNTHHNYFQNSIDAYAQDTWSVAPKLTLNYGVRYTYPGVLGASDGPLTEFIPGQGMVSTDTLYPADKTDFSPRAGFTFTPTESRKTVLRGGYGLYYDVFAVNFFTANTGFANGGALGVGNNPGGSAPVYSITQTKFQIADGVPVFGTTPNPPYGAFSVSQDLKLPYVVNFNFNVQQQLAPTMILQVGYVGTRGHRLGLMEDINAPAPRVGGVSQAARPLNAQFPTLAAINQLVSVGRSEYNSLQMSLIQSSWHGMSGRLNYTLSHAMDNGSEARNTLPMNSQNIDLDWGNAAFDIRHVISAGFTYNAPALGKGRLGDGWQFNVISTIQSGSPFNITTGADTDGTGDRQDRPNLVGDPFANVVQPTTGTAVRWFDPSAFQLPLAGTYGNLARNAYYGPWFKTVDVSVFKTTKLDRGMSLQLRCEMFNIFNWINWANPGASMASSTTFGLMSSTRNATNAPGIGAGEPFNVQLAAKLLW